MSPIRFVGHFAIFAVVAVFVCVACRLLGVSDWDRGYVAGMITAIWATWMERRL